MNSASHAEPEKLWNFNYTYLLCLSAVSTIAFQMVVPVIPLFSEFVGASSAFAGIIMGIFSFTALVVRPFSGLIADRMNKKWIIVISFFFTAISVICYAAASGPGSLFALRILHGVFFSISGTTNIAFASAYIPRHRMGEGIGYLGLGQILATAVGPPMGLYLSSNFGYLQCFLCSGLLSALSAVLLIFLKYRHTPTAKKARVRLNVQDLISVKLLPFAMFCAIISLANGLVTGYIALMAEQRGIGNIGLFFTVNAVVLLIIRPLCGKLHDRKGLAIILIPSFALTGVTMWLLAVASSLPVALLAAVAFSAGMGAGFPAIQAECIKRLPGKSGVATSTFFVGADIGQTIGPMLGGVVVGSLGFTAMYGGAGIIMFVGMVAYFFFNLALTKREKNETISM